MHAVLAPLLYALRERKFVTDTISRQKLKLNQNHLFAAGYLLGLLIRPKTDAARLSEASVSFYELYRMASQKIELFVLI
jgi:hypothetical protein